MDVVVKIEGDKAVLDRLRRLGNGVLDLDDPMRKIGKFLTTFFSGQVFASRGRIIGEPWAPLNDRYAAYKARRFPGRPPLVRSGEMIRSFSARTTRNSASIGNTAAHFPFHQEGTGRMPARVMMKVDQQREADIIGIIEQHIRGALT